MQKPSNKVLTDFISFLRERYKKLALPNGSKKFNPKVLWELFEIYFRFLKLVADPKLTMINQKQLDAYKMAVMLPKCAIWRTRRGGKTIMMAVLEVFWSLIEFGDAYPGKVVHRTPALPQLNQYHEWLKKVPFVTKINNQSHFISVLKSEPIWSGCSSDSNSDGWGCSVLYEDEWGTYDQTSVKFTYLKSTRVFIAEGCEEGKRHFKASTAHYGSVFHKDMDDLEALGEETGINYIHILPKSDCPWISDQFVEDQAKENFDDPSFVDEQFHCKLVPKGGLFFKPTRWIIAGQSSEYPLSIFNQYPTNRAGWDFNGSKTGHIEIRGFHDPDQHLILVKSETAWQKTDAISSHINGDFGVVHEVEGRPKNGGYNAGFCENLLELNTRCLYSEWDNKLKHQRLVILQNSMIVVHPSCSWLIRNLREAIYDPTKLDNVLLKTTNQHGMDALMHMVHGGGALDVAEASAEDGNMTSFESTMQYLRMRGAL